MMNCSSFRVLTILPFVVAVGLGLFLSVASHELGWSTATSLVVAAALLFVLGALGVPLMMLPLARQALVVEQTRSPRPRDPIEPSRTGPGSPRASRHGFVGDWVERGYVSVENEDVSLVSVMAFAPEEAGLRRGINMMEEGDLGLAPAAGAVRLQDNAEPRMVDSLAATQGPHELLDEDEHLLRSTAFAAGQN
jgi:hypothetical protein